MPSINNPSVARSLPGSSPVLLTADAAAQDISAIDGESLGGITARGSFRTILNGLGQTLYFIVCPNDLETNQDSRGDIVFARLVVASVPNGGQDTIHYEWKMAETVTGRSRLFTCTSWTAATPARKIITGVWTDSTTPITFFRMRAILADGSNLANTPTMLKVIPTAPGTSYQAWNALGNP